MARRKKDPRDRLLLTVKRGKKQTRLIPGGVSPRYAVKLMAAILLEELESTTLDLPLKVTLDHVHTDGTRALLAEVSVAEELLNKR